MKDKVSVFVRKVGGLLSWAGCCRGRVAVHPRYRQILNVKSTIVLMNALYKNFIEKLYN